MVPQVTSDIRCELGEGPLWSARDNAIYWVDIIGQSLHRLSLADSKVSSWQMPEKIGWVVERRSKPGFIAGFQSGFVELTLEPFAIRPIADPEPHYPGNRMNDCTVDRDGRIWAGTMDVEIVNPTGSLYRLDQEFRIRRMDSDYLVTNGPAINLAHDRMYHTDTGRGTVYRFELTASGEIANRGVFLQFPQEWGLPDGMTVDAEDHLWIAHWGGGRVSRFTPQGELDRAVKLPASQITCCVFAGENLDRMFVTSAAQGRRDEPLAGALFEIDPGVRGIAPHLFAG
jgi:sugar lactone lactonase YvrE